MDPVEMIVAALTAGAVSAFQDTASQAVKDAYGSLRDLLLKKLQDNPKAKDILNNRGGKPEANSGLLADAIRKSGASEDEKIMLAAKKLARMVGVQSEKGKYTIEIHGDARGVVTGDNANVTIEINEFPEKQRKKKRQG